MEIKIVDNYAQLSSAAAKIVSSEIKNKKQAVIGLATGSTPEGMYAELVSMCRKGVLDFSDTTTFNLDEYVSLEREHPQSYHYFMYKHLFSLINIKPENIHIPDGVSSNLERECSLYDLKIADSGGIDLQILGIGPNGHIGFNEPGRELKVNTHIVKLTAETIEANSRFFDDPGQVPRTAITMGMGSIMNARQILLLASGKSKSAAINRTVNGLINTEIPASLLQLHPNVTIMIDREAAEMIS